MIFKAPNFIKHKSKVAFVSIFLVFGFLLNLYANKVNFSFLDNLLAPSATITVDKSSICIEEITNITFTGSGGVAPYTFTYQQNNGGNLTVTSSGDLASIEFKNAAAGDYTFKLIRVVDNINTSQTITGQEITITVNPLPTSNFTFNDNACSGEIVQFNATETGIAPFTYSWDFADGNTSTLKNPTHVFDNLLGCGTTPFDVKLVVTDGNGCSITRINRVTINQKPDIEFRDQKTRESVFSNCDNISSSGPNYEVIVENISTATCVNSYFIDWGDGSTTAAASFPATHTYTSVGVFNMKISGTGNNGCVNEVSYQVKNVSNPAGGFESPGNTSNLCLPTNDLNFGITNWGLNSSDTMYFVDFGDGVLETYTQAELEASSSYDAANPANSTKFLTPHSYNRGSCSEINGQFVATLTVQNACSSTPFTISNITVLTSSEANFDAPNSSCINTSILFDNLSIIGDESSCLKNADIQWDFGDGTIRDFLSVETAEDIQYTYTEPGTYTVSLSIISKCGTDVFTKEICIEPEITPNFTVNTEDGCIPLNVNTTNTTNQTELCSVPVYLWTVAYTSDNCGITENFAFVNGTDENSENPEFVFNTPGKYELTQTINTSCGAETSTKIINVKKPPTVTINPINDFCGATTINPIANVENCTTNTGSITYNWTFIGGTPATSTSLNPGDITYNTTGTYEVTLEITNECGVSNTATQSFEIFEKPTLTNTDLTQEICSGQSTSEIIITSDNPLASYAWVATADANISGFIANGNSNIIPAQTLINNGTTPEQITFTATATSGICESDELEFIITVNPSPEISSQPISSEICLNGTATLLEVAYQKGTGAPSYQWFSNKIDANSGGNLIAGETTASYNPPTSAIGETFYYVEISFATGGCSFIVSNTASVNVQPQITVNAVDPPQTICVGGTANELEVSFSGGTGNASYQWFSNTTNTNSGGNPIAGATNNTYIPNAFTSVGTFYFYAEISLDGNGCTSGASDVFEINVLTDPVIDSQPIATQELCQSVIPTDLSFTASGGTTAALTYQWFINNTNSTAGGTAIAGANANIYTPETTTVGTFYYYAIVSQPESGCNVTSTISQLIINDAPSFTTQPISSDICLNGTATLLEVTYQNGTGTPNYQWFSNTIDANSGGNPITGETLSSYNPPTNTVGETFYYVEISFATGGCSLIVSNTASVNVQPQITVDAVAAPQIICIDGVVNPLEVNFSGGSGNATYQWFANNTNVNSGGTLIAGATNKVYTPNAFTTNGSFYFYAEIALDGNGCSSATSNTFEINVLPDPIIDSQPIPLQEFCQNATPNNLAVTVSGGTTSAKTYQWFINNTNSTTGGTIITGANSNTYVPETSTIGTFYYYVVVAQNESGCSVTSDVSTLIINEAPTFTKQTTNSEVCLNEPATLLQVAYQNGTGTPNYQWFSNTFDVNSGGNAIAGETTNSYTPPTNNIGETFYYVEISFSSGGCSTIISNTAKVTVNEIPVINDAAITIYSEATFTFNPSSVIGNTVPTGTKYTWSAPTFNPAGSIIGASASTNPEDEISQTLENTGVTPIVVTYIITPATTKCIGASFVLEVTVNPTIKSNAVVTNISCFEANDGEIATNITGGIPFTSGNPYLISWFNSNGFTSTETTITNLEVGIYTLRIEDSTGFFITEEWTVTQPNLLAITKNVERNISCFQGNDGTLEVTISGGTAPYTYNWSTTNGSGIVPNTKNQNTLTAGSYVLEIIDQNNCKVSTNFILTAPDALEVIALPTEEILCFGDAAGEIEINVSGGTPFEVSPGVFDYLYSWSGPNGFTSASKNISNLVSGTFTVNITDSLGCTASTSVVVNQATEIEINFTKIDVTCYDKADGSIDLTVMGGKEPYQIAWSNFGNGLSQSNLTADTYTATITDANNCVKQIDITIEQPIFFIDPIVKPISCNGDSDASIDLNLVGGIAPISVTWNDDASAGIQRNNLSAGTYTVTILDSDTNQCPIVETFVITNPPAIAVSTIVVDAIDCDIANSGSINLDVSGGTAPYTFLWNTNETSEDLNNIPQGEYAVTITDANGCSLNRQFTIFRQEPLNISFTETTLTDCDLKTVNKQTKANVTGGYLPYTYTWSAGSVSTTDSSIMTTDQTGSYSLTITDDKGCTATKSFSIDVTTIGDIEFRYSAFALTTYDFLSIEDPIQFTNLSTGDYTSLKWDFGDGSPTTNEENPIHTYDEVGTFTIALTAEFAAGCIETFTRIVTITKGYKLINPTAFTPNGDGFNETIRPSHRGFKTLKMIIYDTWGTTIYTEEGTDLKGWNGFGGEKPAENGNYVMVIQGITFFDKKITVSSPVTLLK